MFLRLYEISNCKDKSICELGSRINNMWEWKLTTVVHDFRAV